MATRARYASDWFEKFRLPLFAAYFAAMIPARAGPPGTESARKIDGSMGHIFRALVMLACLAVVPVVAMYGKQIQEFGRAVLETYRARIGCKQETAAPAATGTATLQITPQAAPGDPMLSASPWDNSIREPKALPTGGAAAGSPQRPLADGGFAGGTGKDGGAVLQASFSDAPTAAKNGPTGLSLRPKAQTPPASSLPPRRSFDGSRPGYENWGPRIICWKLSDPMAINIASIAGWRSRAIRITAEIGSF